MVPPRPVDLLNWFRSKPQFYRKSGCQFGRVKRPSPPFQPNLPALAKSKFRELPVEDPGKSPLHGAVYPIGHTPRLVSTPRLPDHSRKAEIASQSSARRLWKTRSAPMVRARRTCWMTYEVCLFFGVRTRDDPERASLQRAIPGFGDPRMGPGQLGPNCLLDSVSHLLCPHRDLVG